MERNLGTGMFPKNTSYEQLILAAKTARSHAYAPYSGFPVGAAVLAPDGQIFSGCNVENLAYGATICAERSAVLAAVSSGVREISAVAIISNDPDPCLPCGTCRQVLSEFCGANTDVLACRKDGTYRKFRFGELFPNPFQSTEIRRGEDK